MNNKGQIDFLKQTWIEGYKSIKVTTAKNEGFDTSKKEIIIGNYKLVKDGLFYDYYKIKLINIDNDLDNNPISENNKAFKYIQTLYNQGTTEIHSKDLYPFNLNTKLGKFSIGNVQLTQIGISEKYRISLLNPEMSTDGKLKDESVNYKNVIQVLQEFSISKKKLQDINEVKLNDELEKHFRKHFENAHKSTGKLRGLFDLVIGNLDFVIELKLSKSIKNSGARQRASGQIKQYLKEYQSKNFLLLVVGNIDDKQDKNIKSLEKEITKEYKCFYHFLETE
ncbi:MAG: hypothetical protein K8R54_14075 [Bacteroidales bacterium]|nr:hypothetical protein [Bacteroidales bacterium]